jgi:hypothetical protein
MSTIMAPQHLKEEVYAASELSDATTHDASRWCAEPVAVGNCCTTCCDVRVVKSVHHMPARWSGGCCPESWFCRHPRGQECSRWVSAARCDLLPLGQHPGVPTALTAGAAEAGAEVQHSTVRRNQVAAAAAAVAVAVAEPHPSFIDAPLPGLLAVL